MKFLIDDFNLDCTGDMGANALSGALADGQPDTVNFLLDKKVPIVERNRNPVNQIGCILSPGSKEAIKILFSQPGVDKEKLSRMAIDAIQSDYENEIANSYMYDSENDSDNLEKFSALVQSAKNFIESL